MSLSLLRTGRVPLLACLAALAAAACGSGARDGASLTLADDPSATVFLTPETPPNSYMEALYRGRVVRDAKGCLRLDSGSTVVWPHGFTLEARGDELVVKDASGRVVGQIGGSFRFGGGGVDSVDHVENLSGKDRARAAEHCPGSYWVAAP